MIINFEKYRKYLESRKMAVSTIRGYETAIKQFNKYLVANGYTKLSGKACEGFKEYMLIDKGYKISTVNHKIIVLNTYFNYLKREEKVRGTRRLKLHQEKVQSVNNREYLVMSEYNAVYKACRHDETKLLMKIMAQTGLRITEATTLTLNQIKQDNIPINNKGKWRVVGMDEMLKAEIRRFFRGKSPQTHLFNYSQTTYRNRMTEAAKLAGVDTNKVYPHAFRHYFAKEYLRTSTDNRALRMLQTILGHSDVSTTMIYLQFNNSEVVATMVNRNKEIENAA